MRDRKLLNSKFMEKNMICLIATPPDPLNRVFQKGQRDMKTIEQGVVI
jgi:hypothetical protein